MRIKPKTSHLQALVEKPVCATESCATDQISSRKHGMRDPKQQTSRKVSLRDAGPRRAKFWRQTKTILPLFPPLRDARLHTLRKEALRDATFVAQSQRIFLLYLIRLGGNNCKPSCSSCLHQLQWYIYLLSRF